MRKVFIAFAFFALGSCLSESSVKPGSSSTFIRYFSGGNNDVAQAMEIAPDGGFIILATTRIQKAESDIPNFKIKLIKTDPLGNPVWQMLYPAVDVKDKNYTAGAIQIIPSGGYVITGDDIQANGTIKALLMTVDDIGGLTKSASYNTSTGQTVRGKAVAVNAAGNFLVLSTSGNDKMYLTEIDKNTFQSVIPNPVEYAAGQTNLSNRLLIDELGKAVWSGVVTKSGLTGIRLIKTTPNSINTDFDLLISIPGFNEVGKDFCKYGLGYALTGSTNQKNGVATPGTDTDILFKRLSSDGTVLSSTSFPIENQNDEGNSISTTLDGGLILLSSANSAGIAGRGDTDFYLIKINAFGDKTWTSAFGSKFKDEGVTVRQTSDSGYVVLGTTTQGSLKIITLLKTDKNGKIE